MLSLNSAKRSIKEQQKGWSPVECNTFENLFYFTIIKKYLALRLSGLAQGQVTCRLIAGWRYPAPHSKYNNNADILKSSWIYSPPALVLGAGHPDWLIGLKTALFKKIQKQMT